MDELSADRQAEWDYQRAQRRSFLRRTWALLSGQDIRLLSFEKVRERLHIGGMVYRGIKSVPVEKIVGSVNRYHDFDRVFLPTQTFTGHRWRSISRAFYQDVNLSPVQLYQVGDVYFVVDGNHRVSVARSQGVAYLDAEVRECHVRVPVTADLKPEDLIILGEKVEFLERTRLDELRPDADVEITVLGGYDRLLEHIAVRRYFLGLEWQRHLPEDEAVTNWYDTLYLPLVQIIREQEILTEFPRRTEGDLYLWIRDHQHFLRDQFGDDLEAAAADFADQHTERPVKKLIQTVERLVDEVMGDEEA